MPIAAFLVKTDMSFTTCNACGCPISRDMAYVHIEVGCTITRLCDACADHLRHELFPVVRPHPEQAAKAPRVGLGFLVGKVEATPNEAEAEVADREEAVTAKSEEKKPEEKKPEVVLCGEDGNAFLILGRCSRAAKKAGWSEAKRAEVFAEMKAGDYDHLLQTAMKYFEVT